MKKNEEEPKVNPPKDKITALAEILERTRWASEFSWDQIYKICEYVKPVRAREGVFVFQEGDVEKSVGIIVKGAIDIYKDKEGELSKITTLQTSFTFGEMSLIDGESRSATGIASQESIIYFISRENLILLANDNPALGFKLLWKISKIISQRLRNTTGKLVDLL
ncbi:MAG: cyclic nucleotide-binding domain-containing protein [Desulfobacterium sp.]|nr:cyclic nucleotide-binding domain-containing protein [Desulfobacterium sp.]